MFVYSASPNIHVFFFSGFESKVAIYINLQSSDLPMQAKIVSIANISLKKGFLILFESLNGFWNLDFFRTLYPRFCLHPNMSTLQVLALDYIIAAYPLLLITYTLVKLHNCNCRLVVCLWKPFRIILLCSSSEAVEYPVIYG